MEKDFSLTRVVSRDVITDSFQGLRNLFGLRLRGYEKRINQHTNELIEEMKLRYKKILWWRFSINPLTNGSVMITIYGGYKK